jgi:hypothetical protein
MITHVEPAIGEDSGYQVAGHDAAARILGRHHLTGLVITKDRIGTDFTVPGIPYRPENFSFEIVFH